MSIKAWNDEQEVELTKLYIEEGIKDVHELAAIFEKGYRSVITTAYAGARGASNVANSKVRALNKENIYNKSEEYMIWLTI